MCEYVETHLIRKRTSLYYHYHRCMYVHVTREKLQALMNGNQPTFYLVSDCVGLLSRNENRNGLDDKAIY